MIKKTFSLLVSLLALFIAVTGCSSKGANQANVSSASATPDGSTTNSNSGASPLSSPTSTPLLDSSSKTLQVRLAVVETNADLIDSPIPDSKVMIKSGEISLNKLTDDKGVVLFDSVPCGNDVVITARDEENEVGTVLNRSLKCEGTQVDLGVLVKPFGGKFILEQRKAQYIEYDPGKNEWRSEGKVVPNEKIRKILGKYQ